MGNLDLDIVSLAELRSADITVNRPGHESLHGISVLGITFAAAAYGSVVSAHGEQSLRTMTPVAPTALAFVALIIGTIGQLFIYQRRDHAHHK